jgi:hypothetical protein
MDRCLVTCVLVKADWVEYRLLDKRGELSDFSTGNSLSDLYNDIKGLGENFWDMTVHYYNHDDV